MNKPFSAASYTAEVYKRFAFQYFIQRRAISSAMPLSVTFPAPIIRAVRSSRISNLFPNITPPPSVRVKNKPLFKYFVFFRLWTQTPFSVVNPSGALCGYSWFFHVSRKLDVNQTQSGRKVVVLEA